VLMAPPAGASIGDVSTAIFVKGYAHGVVVRHNTVRGRARTGLAMWEFHGGVPVDNEFLDNRFDGFKATLADILIGPGVVQRRIVGPGTLLDQGARASAER